MVDNKQLKPEITALLNPVVDQLTRHQITGDKTIALEISHLLMRVISATRWSNPYDLVNTIRQVGVVLQAALPREFICGNIVRRVLSIIRVEIEENLELDPNSESNTMMSSIFSLLSTNNNTVKQESLIQSKKQSSDLRSIIIQGIRDLIDEIINVNEGLENMSADLIHDNEILLTPTPNSSTVLQFLIKARSKRKFTVLVTENYPNEIEQTHKFIKKLADNKIETILIPDTTTFAMMSRVGKVIVGSNTVFANGGCMSNSGVSNVVECAREHKTPVFAVAGLYKLSPLYPFNRNDLIKVGNSGKVLNYSDYELLENVDIITNPLNDYIPPENIDIYITNIGGFAPSFIYRIVLDNYKPEDNNLE
ncbi:GCD complex subunit gcd7 [Yamadazyma tenuis]|uniref:Translation initiation factor eIF2B subunit beta n=1 Tax=Candida tenuis (strain ATCC 10573 / BCRC 21748 / CBS 615 / JCM 9827 / NBRC 10315 / NRRL Y-1498 / VKM Y-70) TaxID=590646 RepID=G3AXY4_CANTC|nr:IF-2B-domain-containing protein [Yamadazyma tenuis ATCC 10573]EGV65724.1 IF-2B-domain-containing protein [Yamadazyma tenuis ATCC 10573]WEJ95962.1 GCD complex subunit gcd7 [Yamadazyma tenuis]